MRKSLLVLSAATMIVAGTSLILWSRLTGSRADVDQVSSQTRAVLSSQQEVKPKICIMRLPSEKMHDITSVFSDSD
jgi:hypothetical protein